MILNGELAAGERLLEVALAEQLNTSRTPVRAAFVRLAEEGLLEKVSTVGYTVREFTLRDIEDAIEMRGTIEGMAVRLAAERGIDPQKLKQLQQIVNDIDILLHTGDISNHEEIEQYFDLNAQFHDLIRAAAESFVVEHLYGRLDRLPFASPNAFVIAQSQISQTNSVFQIGNAQHRAIVDAIAKRQGSRAEHLTREHARLSLQTLTRTLQDRDVLTQVQGAPLIVSAIEEANGAVHSNGVSDYE